jgi:hypothetical protein
MSKDIRKHLALNEHSSLNTATAHVNSKLPGEQKVCRETVRTHVTKQLGLKAYRRPNRCKMTARSRARRLAYAKRMKQRQRRDEHKRTLWTDECHIELNGKGNPFKWMWARKRSDVKPISVARSPIKLAMWAGISYSGKTELHFYDRMNQQEYVRILTSALDNRKMTAMFGRGTKWVFQQDGASSHAARSTTQWLTKHVPEFMTSGRQADAVWPTYSPDLNPIEHLWSVVKRAVYRRADSIETKEQLKQVVLDAWREISQEVICKCIDTLPPRWAKVISAKGDVIHL